MREGNAARYNNKRHSYNNKRLSPSRRARHVYFLMTLSMKLSQSRNLIRCTYFNETLKICPQSLLSLTTRTLQTPYYACNHTSQKRRRRLS